MLVVGCGPSFQAIYEGDARFERCYALEDTGAASMSDKASCWNDWLERSRYGQTRERIEYADARHLALVNALVNAPSAPTDEALMAAAPGVIDTSAQLAAPTPISAFSPPPVTARPLEPVSVPPVKPAALRAPPASACLESCAASWRSCSDKSPCDSDYARCVTKCVAH